MAFVTTTADALRALSRVGQHKIGYGAVTLLVFFASVFVLASLDLLPERKTSPVATASSVEQTIPTAPVVVPELPTHIKVPSINLSATILNPESTEVAKLDAALHNGAVRYPLSAKLGADGNVIVFGHSSYLPIVNNQAYKTFNEIQKLKKDDQILVTGTSRTYVYAVDTVNSANAGTDAIPLTVTGSMLTLATCDSFGTKSDRFVVTAHLVESYPIAS